MTGLGPKLARRTGTTSFVTDTRTRATSVAQRSVKEASPSTTPIEQPRTGETLAGSIISWYGGMTVVAVRPTRRGQEVDVERAPGGVAAGPAVRGTVAPLRDKEFVARLITQL